MTTAELLNAHNTYAAEYAAWEAAHPFDLMTAMDRPEAPPTSIQAAAGALIAEYGLAQALAHALTHAMEGGDLPDRTRAVYMELIVAAVE